MRLIITPKDIQLISGISYNSATNQLRMLKRMLKKTKDQKISVMEYCSTKGLNYNETSTFLFSKTPLQKERPS